MNTLTKIIECVCRRQGGNRKGRSFKPQLSALPFVLCHERPTERRVPGRGLRLSNWRDLNSGLSRNSRNQMTVLRQNEEVAGHLAGSPHLKRSASGWSRRWL